MKVAAVLLLVLEGAAALALPAHQLTARRLGARSSGPAAMLDVAEIYRELIASPPLIFEHSLYYDPWGNGMWTTPISGVRVTASGWVGIVFVLANTLWAPWGLVNVNRRGGLGNPWWKKEEEEAGDDSSGRSRR